MLSILFFILSLPPVNWGFLSFVAFVPLFLFARESRFFSALAAGLLTGLAYFGLLFYWIASYTPAAGAVIIGGLAVYFGLYLAVTGYFLKRSKDIWFDWLFPGALWLTLKWLVCFWKPGFTAIYFGHTLGVDLQQSIYLVGQNGLVLFVFLVNAWIYNFVRSPKTDRRPMIQLLVLAIVLLGMNSFARARLAEKIPADIPIAVIQPNLPYDLEWRKNNYEKIKSVYELFTRRAAESVPKIIIWPQYAFPEDLRVTPNPASRLAQELKTPILLGTYVESETGAKLNVALYFDADGKLAGEYAATMLPPFRFIGQEKGTTLGLIDTAAGKAGVLLCFEDTHPDLTRELVKSGAEFIVLLCNDQFFGRTTEPILHAGCDPLRAIEADRFFVRAAPTGPCQVIDPRGRVLMSTPIFQETLLISQIASRATSPGLFAKTGDLISYLALILLAGLLIQMIKSQALFHY